MLTPSKAEAREDIQRIGTRELALGDRRPPVPTQREARARRMRQQPAQRYAIELEARQSQQHSIPCHR